MKNAINTLLGNASSYIINEFFHSEFGPEFSEYDDDDVFEFKKALNASGIESQYVDSHGGEGQGEDYWSVYKFSKDGEEVYVQFQGWYASYNGAEFNGRFFVTPKQKTITVFEAN